MATIEFVGESGQTGAARAANTSRLLNMYREPVAEGGRTRHILRPVPGRYILATLGGAFLRDMVWADSKVYAARGGKLYFISQEARVTSLGDIQDCPNTSMAGNAGNLAITCNGAYYVYNGSTITRYTDGAFTDYGSVETLSNYTLVTERNGRRFQWSDLADPTTFDALNFATTETRDDNNIRGIAIAGQYWIFKQRSIERYYPTGASGAEAFAAVQGVIDHGIAGFNLITKARGALFYVSSDGTVNITTGDYPQTVSSRGVEVAIREGLPTHCFYHEQYGHKFCVIRFSDRPAWVLDLATMEWHERSTGRLFQAWDAVACVEASSGVFWTGDVDGTISRLTSLVVDQGEPLFRRAVSRTLHIEANRFRLAELEFYGAYGYVPAGTGQDVLLEMPGGGVLEVGEASYLLDEEEGAEPNLMVSTSRDGGATFGAERFMLMGQQGQYNKRTVGRAWGQHRQVTVQVDQSHRFNIPIYSDARIRLA